MAPCSERGVRMPTERLSMRRIRDVLRLKHAQGMGERAIAASLGLGKGTVGTYLARARRVGLEWLLEERAGLSKHNGVAKAVHYFTTPKHGRWAAFTEFLD